MKTYRVSFTIVVSEGHPRKWVPDAVSECLNQPDEDVLDWEFLPIDDGEETERRDRKNGLYGDE